MSWGWRKTKIKKDHKETKLTKKSHHARPCTALKQTEQDSQGVDLVGILGEGNESGHETPSDLETGKPVAGTDVGDDDLGGDEHEAVGDAEEGEEAVWM